MVYKASSNSGLRPILFLFLFFLKKRKIIFYFERPFIILFTQFMYQKSSQRLKISFIAKLNGQHAWICGCIVFVLVRKRKAKFAFIYFFLKKKIKICILWTWTLWSHDIEQCSFSLDNNNLANYDSPKLFDCLFSRLWTRAQMRSSLWLFVFLFYIILITCMLYIDTNRNKHSS